MRRTQKSNGGASFVYKSRSFKENQYTFKDQNHGFAYHKGNLDSYLSDANIGENSVAGQPYGLYVINSSQDRNNYDGSQQLGAAYFLADLGLSDKWRLISGVRTEYNLMYVVSGDDAAEPGKLKELFLLPSVNLNYSYSQKSNLRAAYSRTLAYPTFREVAPFSSFDYLGGFIYNGNPELKVTNINNFDIRWENFMNEGEMIAVSVFYKHFTNPIEIVIAERENARWDNVDAGMVLGTEFEFRKKFNSQLPVLKYLMFAGNISLVASRVDINERELSVIRSVNPDHKPYRAMYGQAPYAINAMLTYKNDASGLNANLAYNVTGKRILLVGSDGVNMMEEPFHSLNANVGYKLNNYISVRAAISNILDSEKFSTYTYDKSYTGEKHGLGRTYSLTLSYSIF